MSGKFWWNRYEWCARFKRRLVGGRSTKLQPKGGLDRAIRQRRWAIISGNHMTPPHVTLFTVRDLYSRENMYGAVPRDMIDAGPIGEAMR